MIVTIRRWLRWLYIGFLDPAPGEVPRSLGEVVAEEMRRDGLRYGSGAIELFEDYEPTEVARLREMADWCDDPSASPPVTVNIGGRAYTPGYLLRRIADEYEEAA